MTGSCHRNYSDRLSLSLSLLAGPRKACFPEPPVVWELAQSSPVSERVRAESWGIWTDTREIFIFFWPVNEVLGNASYATQLYRSFHGV